MTYLTSLTSRRRLQAAVLLFMLLAPPLAEAVPELQEEQTIWIYKQIVPATVFLSSSFVVGPGVNTAGGTGFILDDTGIVVSNAHVVSGAHHVTATLYDGQRVHVDVIGIDHYTDVAVLQLKGFAGPLPTVRLGSSEDLQIGQRTLLIGNPYGLGFGLSSGIISGVNRVPPAVNLMDPRVPLLQTTAPINPGDSGGPLVDSQARVIGITTALLAGTQNIGFAIPINLVKEVVTELKKTGRVQRPWIGVTGKFVTDDIRELFVLPFTDGMLVETVASDSPASHAGLRAGTVDVVVAGQPWMMGGDIIVAINHVPVHAVRDFLTTLKTLRIGETIDVEFLRDRARQTISLVVSERPQEPSAPSGRSSELQAPAQSLPGRPSRPFFRGGQVEGTRPSGNSTDGRNTR